MLKDPVCGKRMARNKAHIAIDYDGVTYFLCCPKCQADFESTPNLYANPEMGQKIKKNKRRH
jgi:YHS domain-containing protein